jgi:hypothetical protein
MDRSTGSGCDRFRRAASSKPCRARADVVIPPDYSPRSVGASAERPAKLSVSAPDDQSHAVRPLPQGGPRGLPHHVSREAAVSRRGRTTRCRRGRSRPRTETNWTLAGTPRRLIGALSCAQIGPRRPTAGRSVPRLLLPRCCPSNSASLKPPIRGGGSTEAVGAGRYPTTRLPRTPGTEHCGMLYPFARARRDF